MDLLAKNKLLLRLVLLLLVLNLALIGVQLWREFAPGPQKREVERADVSAVLQKELGLDDAQAGHLRRLREEFFEKERRIVADLRAGRDSMNAAMFRPDPDSEAVLRLARGIAENEYRMELLRFDQAQRFQAICTPEQRAKFERLVREIRDYFRPENPRPRERNPRREEERPQGGKEIPE